MSTINAPLHQVLCASGTLGPPGDSGVDEILEFGPTLPADGIEILVRHSHQGGLAKLVDPLLASGLRFPVVHLAKGLGARLPAEDARQELADNLRFAREIGAQLGVLHLWDLPDSDRDFPARIEACQVALELASAHGLLLGVESIPCAASTPLDNLRILVDRFSELAVVLDTEFLAMHGQVEATMQDDLIWPHVRHIHIKDFDGNAFHSDGRRRYLPPGEGAIDFVAFSAGLASRGFAGTVSLECGPHRDGDPGRGQLHRVLRVLSTNRWTF